MRWRPFDQALDDLTEGDLNRLIDEDIREGLFVEYKSEFANDKVQRAIASFANTYGGTLIAGMTADDEHPKELVGVPVEHELEMRVVQLVRSSIAPIPAFAVRAVLLNNNRAAVVVEVPESSQTPHIWMPKGQILVRTPAGSEPVGINDRESLDRLFRRGERGRSWARGSAASFQKAYQASAEQVARVRVIPAVDNGLGLHGVIHRQSFFESIATTTRRFPWLSMVRPPEASTDPSFIEARWISSFSDGDYWTRVYVTGEVEQGWEVSQVDAGFETAQRMLEPGLPMIREILEDLVGHRGDVILAVANRWPDAAGDSFQTVQLTEEAVSVGMFDDPEYLSYVLRQLRRHVGRYVFEPEPES
ncbi:MAG: ATP-binding protein [Actinomycetota bacterium]